MNKKHLFSAVFMSLFLAACSPKTTNAPAALAANSTTTQTTDYHDNIYKVSSSAKGQYLTDFQGASLYVFDPDSNGKSTCNGACARIWPAYSSGATAQKTFPTNVTVITRDDGHQQFAWKGKPLYYYSGDNATGDTNGDGVDGTWHLAKP